MIETRPIRVHTAVVGGGQTGLLMGYYLRQLGDDAVIFDALQRVGDSWRQRYDSLRLFSTPRYASLPGWRIPVSGCPTRDEMADYLQAYAQRFQLPVRSAVTVRRVARAEQGPGFRVETTAGTYDASRVIVAAGAHRRPLRPGFASQLDPAIRQLHSLEYRHPAQLAPGGVLVVGAANSGTDLALEAAAAGHETWIAGRHPGQVPIDIDDPRAARTVPIVMFVLRRVLTRDTPWGHRAYARLDGHGVNLVRNKLEDLDEAGVTRIGRITQVVDGRPGTAEGFFPDVRTVLWCTGSGPDFGFLDVPAALDTQGRAVHRRGLSPVDGLGFLGLDFQYSAASSTIQGLAQDARYLCRHLTPARARTTAMPARTSA